MSEPAEGQGLSRRGLFQRALSSIVYLPLLGNKRLLPPPASGPGLGFEPLPAGLEDAIRLPEGYRHEVLLRWGDPILPGAPDFDPARLDPAAQAMQFGYNCDYIAFFPLDWTSGRPDRGLLVVNHEQTHPELIFPGWQPGRSTRHETDVQLAAHGVSVVETYCDNGGHWHVLPDSPRNWRVTGSTETRLSGPALGHPWLRTQADPEGQRVLGTLANCAGGMTPWGTYLAAEENFHEYFGWREKLDRDGDRRFWVHLAYAIPKEGTELGFDRHHRRFDLGHEPNEPFRFGWVLELDPYDPGWTPRKRTALGRLRREGATCRVTGDMRVAVYSGEDVAFQHVHKFVTAEAWNPDDRRANRDLLDRGTLYAARFDPDGTGVWLPLVQGQGPLQPATGFNSQADVLINTVEAGKLVGATRMDRPEGIAVSPETGRVFIALTENPSRGVATEPGTGINAANPRGPNPNGHVIELEEEGGDAGALRFRWRFLMLCGDPAHPDSDYSGQAPEQVSGLACPDNMIFDPRGYLWIATDGQEKTLGFNDGLYAVPVDGAERGRARRFFQTVRGAEVTGPCFNPDGRTLFLSVQHPGEGGTLASPRSDWPDRAQPPRPSVIVIQAEDGRVIGAPPPGDG